MEEGSDSRAEDRSEEEQDEQDEPDEQEDGEIHEEQESCLVGSGLSPLALALHRALLLAALNKLGLRGPPAGLAAWCWAFGRLGLASCQVKQLFDALDTSRGGKVQPAAFCNPSFCREAFDDILTSSLDLVFFTQLKYRLLLLGLTGWKAEPAKLLGTLDLVQTCRDLRIVIEEPDAEAFIKEILLRCGQLGAGSPQSVSVPACRVQVGGLCQQLSVWSTSAARLQSSTFSERPWSRENLQSTSKNGRQRTLPPHFEGKTAIEIVVHFKDPSTFPWQLLPQAACCLPFEELWRLAEARRTPIAEEAVQLLLDTRFDRVRADKK